MSLSALHQSASEAGRMALGLSDDDLRIEKSPHSPAARLIWTLPDSTHDSLGGAEIAVDVTPRLWAADIDSVRFQCAVADEVQAAFRQLLRDDADEHD